MKNLKRSLYSVLIIISSAFLISCGGSDTASDPDPVVVKKSLSGTAATGAAVLGTVFAKDAKGQEVQIASGVTGSFTLNTTGLTPPFILKIIPNDGSPALYSYAESNGQTVNVTSLTNLVLFLAGNKGNLSASYTNWNGQSISLNSITQSLKVVQANLKDRLLNEGIKSSDYDFFTQQFLADQTGIDKVMDGIKVTVDTANASFGVSDTSNNLAISFDENIDVTAPVVTTPNILTVSATSASGVSATDNTIVIFLASVSATDNIAVVGGVSNDAPTVFPVGTTEVTFIAVDAQGNAGSVKANVVVSAFATPQYSISAVVSGLSNGGGVTLLSGSDSLTFTTNSTQTFVSTLDSGANYSVSVRSTSSGISCAVSPNSGKITANTSVQVTCGSTAIPKIVATSPVNNAEFTASSNGTADVPISVIISNFDLANGAWNMQIDGANPTAAFFTTSTTMGFSVGSHTVVFQLTGPGKTYTPLAIQQTDTVTFLVKSANSADTTAPVVTSPQNITVAATGASGILASNTTITSFLSGATATDNIAVVGNITNDNTLATLPVGTTTVNFSASDAAGNKGTASATITVTAAITQYAIKGTISGLTGNGFIGSWELRSDGNSLINDGGISANGTVTFGNVNDGATYTVSTGVATCTITNASGTVNATDVTNISIDCGTALDTTNPVVTAPNNIIVTATSQSGIDVSNATISAFLNAATATDNVAVIGNISNDNVLTTLPIGVTTVTFSASDAAGNTGTVSATITVNASNSSGLAVTGDTYALIAFGKNSFVASNGSQSVKSSDGLNWVTGGGIGFPATSIIFDGTQFVAMQANAGQIATSSDGTTWSVKPFNLTIIQMTDLSGLNGQYIGVGGTQAYVSTDLTAWQKITSGLSLLKGVAFNGTTSVIVNKGGLSYSTDNGQTWTAGVQPSINSNNNPLQGVVWENSQFIAFGKNILVTSKDGKSWISKVSAYKYGSITDIAFSNGIYTLASGVNIYVGSQLNRLEKIAVIGINSIANADVNQVAANSTGLFTLTGTNLISGTPVIPTAILQNNPWELVMPKQTISNLERVVWTGSQYLVGGDFSRFVSSSDGVTWSMPKDSGTLGVSKKDVIAEVVDSGSLLIGLSPANNNHRISADGGIYWDYIKPNQDVKNILFYNNVFIAQANKQTYTSSDGITWVVGIDADYITALVATKGTKGIVTNGNSQFIRLHPTNANQSAIQSSTDAINWSTVSSFSAGYSGNDIGLLYDGTQFIIVSSKGIYISSDGLTWSLSRALNVSDMTYDGTNYVAVGSQGRIWKGTSIATLNLVSGGVDFSIDDLMDAGTKLVAVGSRTIKDALGNFNGEVGVIATSTDKGVTWVEQSIPTAVFVARFSGSSPGNTTALKKIKWSGSQFVAVGVPVDVLDVNSNVVSNSQLVLTSPDAITWTFRDTGFTYDNTVVERVTNFEFVADRFIYFAASAFTANVYQSTDQGITWMKVTASMPETASSIYFLHDGSQYIGAVNNGNIYSSADFITWSMVGNTPQNDIKGIVFTSLSGSEYTAISTTNIYKSSDLITWVLTTGNAGAVLKDIDFVGGKIVATGPSNSPTILNSSVFSSTDGITWSSTTFPVSGYDWTDVFALDGQPAIRSGNVIVKSVQ